VSGSCAEEATSGKGSIKGTDPISTAYFAHDGCDDDLSSLIVKVASRRIGLEVA
jgi:hypothetical protein